MGIGARDDGDAAFKRLAQRFQHRPLKLRQLIEKENPAMSERNLTGLHTQAPAHHRRHTGGVMGRAERALAADAARIELTGKGRDHRHFERFFRLKRGQDAGQALGEHGFAGARRARHQEIVGAGRRDFEGALGCFLTLDVGEVGKVRGVFREARDGRAERAAPLKVIDEAEQV